MDTVIDYINIQRILGLPGKAVKKQELQCWTLPDDTQVDTGDHGIESVPGGHVIVEVGPKQFRFYSMEEFNELFVLAEDFKNEYDDVEDIMEVDESVQEHEITSGTDDSDEPSFRITN